MRMGLCMCVAFILTKLLFYELITSLHILCINY